MQSHASLKLQRTCRINHLLCKPSILNQFSSNKQLKFLFEIVKTSFLGRTIIDVKEWSEKLSTSRDLIRKTIKIFEQLNIITKRTNNEYEFNYYTSMTKDQKGYVKYFSIFENQSFERLPLQSKRVIIYLLSEFFTGTSTKSRERSIILDISSWYGDENSNRIFPFWHKAEIKKALLHASEFIDIDLSFMHRNQIAIKGVLFDESDVAYSDDRAIWLINLLNNYNIFYINEFHIKHFVNFFEHLESHFGLEIATEILEDGLNKLSNPMTDEDKKKKEIFLSKLYKSPTFGNNGNVVSDFSEAVIYFRDYFISESMSLLMKTAKQEIERIESEAESIFNKMPKMMFPKAVQKKVVYAYKMINTSYRHNVELYNSFLNYIDQHANKAINQLNKWNINVINEPQDIVKKADEFLAVTISSMPTFVKHMILKNQSLKSIKNELSITVMKFNEKIERSLNSEKSVGEIGLKSENSNSNEDIFSLAEEYLATVSITDEEKTNFFERIKSAELKSKNKSSIFKYFEKVVETVKQLGSNKSKNPYISEQSKTDKGTDWLEELFKTKEQQEQVQELEDEIIQASQRKNGLLWRLSISKFQTKMIKKVTNEELDKIKNIIKNRGIKASGNDSEDFTIIQEILHDIRNK